MSDIVSPLLQWLNANPEWASFATFLISASESVAIIGTIVPGSITMTAIGTLAGAGIIPLWETLFWATLGAIVGDGISYWMGHYFKNRIRKMWPFRDNPGFLEKGEVFVHKYGVMSVFIGRFVGPVRALVPLVAGMLGMKPLQFTIANVTSAIGWAPVYMLPGILLGAASLELPPDIAVHAILVLFLIFLFVMLIVWFAYKLFQLIGNQIEQMLVNFWNGLKNSRYFRTATIVLKHHDPKQHHGQLTLAFYFLLTSFLFIALTIYVKAVGPTHIFVNDMLFHLFRGVRTPGIDHWMLNISLLGQKQVILPVIGTLFLWLFFTKHRRTAFHVLALGVLAAGSIFIFKNLFHVMRPWGITQSPETFSMPSGHTTLATAIYVGIAFFMASAIPTYRRLIYIPAILLALIIGVSRIYLGAHWFTDVLAAWLLGSALLILVMLSYHRHEENRLQPLSIFIVTVLTLIFSYGFYYHCHIKNLTTAYAQANWPSEEIALATWWEKDEAIPESRVSLFGFRSQIINLQWVGPLDEIKKTLLQEGWSMPPARDWISTLHRLTDIKSNEFLPMVSPQYLDKSPELILAKRINGKKKLLVLRIWASNRIIKETNMPLWVGTVGVSPRSYNWLFRKKYDIEFDPTLVLQSKTAMRQWEWKVLTVSLPSESGKSAPQKVLLIRKKQN